MYSIVFLISSLRGLKKTGTGELGSSTKSVGNIKRKNSKNTLKCHPFIQF